MTTLSIAWKNLRHNLASSALGTLLTAFGTGILCILLLSSDQLEDQLERNSKGIDLVIGAKGSPLQLILNSIYHTDYPTGNIPYAEALELADNPLVKLAVPLSLGDNYKGYRIVGTDSSFLTLYNAKIGEGRWINTDFETVIGAEAAHEQQLKPGDRIHSAHGLSDKGDVHEEHPYIVSGILAPTRTIVDRLILTNLESVWAMHGLHAGEDHAGEDEEEQQHDEEQQPTFNKLMGYVPEGREITSMLIRYRSPAAIAMFPRMVNQSTSMQAASPAMESARLFSLIGIGIDTLQYLAVVIMIMALLSIFVSLYHALKARKFDLAIMRTLGASRGKLFSIIVTEGMLITLTGTILGLAAGHLVIYFISTAGENSASLLNAAHINPKEGLLLMAGIISGFAAAVIPAIGAYRTPISRTLSNQ